MNIRSVMATALVLGMAGCASTPVPNAALENARAAVRTTEADPNVAKYAALDLEAAKKQLDIAEAAAMRRDDAAVGQPAYLASQTARLAQLRASAKADDARVAEGQEERNRIQLAARDREVAEAKRQADLAAAKEASLKAEADALKAKRHQ